MNSNNPAGVSPEKIFKATFLVLGTYTFFLFVFTSFIKISYPYAVNLGEPALAQTLMRFSEGKIPYKDVHTPPYTLVPYGPVYVILATLTRWAAKSPFVGPRSLCFLSTLLCATLIFLILKKYSVKAWLAATCAVLFLSQPYIRRWGVQVNVDMMGVMWSLAALFVYSSYLLSNAKKKSLFYLGIFLSTLAFFTKSSMMALPAAFFLQFLFAKQFKKAFLFAILQGTSILLIYGLLNVWTHGWYFFHTTLEISKRQFYWQFIGMNWKAVFFDSPFLVIGGILFLLARLWQKKMDIFFFYFILVLFLTVSVGKQGSDTNYMLEWVALSCVLVGFLSQIFDRVSSWGLKAVFLAAVALQITQGVYAEGSMGDFQKFYAERKQVFDKMSVAFKSVDGKILSADMGLLIANGKEIVYEPFPMGQMSYSGVWDNAPVIEMLDKQEFRLAMLTFYAPKLIADRNFPRNFMKKFNERYHLIGRAPVPTRPGEPVLTYFFYAPTEIIK